MIQIEVWNTGRDERTHTNEKGGITMGKLRSDYQLCTEVVQSEFLSQGELQHFGNLCHSSGV